MKAVNRFSLLMLVLLLMFVTGCKKKDGTVTIPTLTTSAVTNITTSTATSGGTISDNGGGSITASGIAWSKTNPTPTISDDTTKGTTASGTFTANLKSITPSATWYVRAYATNSAGTGYGNVVSFATGNGAPEARSINVTGTIKVAERLTATYTYFDFENDPQSGTTFQWYRANDAAGSGEVAIAGATSLTYTLQVIDEFKFIRIGIIAKSSAGTSPGTEVKSAFIGPVAAPETTVTFNYNGASVTYGILVSSATGRRWLDRNLGAPNAPTAFNDFANYGDAFQWGRAADGHQLTTRAATTGGTTGINGTDVTLSTTDIPGHNRFILNPTASGDWRNPQNNNLWQGGNGINNPCPSGWRIPTLAELTAETFTNLADAYTKLKITAGGSRSASTGAFVSTTTSGAYWSSTIDPSISVTGAMNLRLSTSGVPVYSDSRAQGSHVRCIKD